VQDKIGNPNTFAWSPDKTRFYTADSVRQIMWVFDYDVETGAISNRREFFSLVGTNIIPDGSTVDAEGFLWNAQWNGWRIVRYAPDGSIDRIVEMPVACPTSCIFGGENLNNLYVTSARKGQTVNRLEQQPDAGALFVLDVGVRGIWQDAFILYDLKNF
jgi:L-arabinonolactonase